MATGSVTEKRSRCTHADLVGVRWDVEDCPYCRIAALERAIHECIMAINGGDRFHDEDVGVVYKQSFGEAFLLHLQNVRSGR